MLSGDLRVKRLLAVTLISLVFLIGFPGMGAAVKPRGDSSQEPESFRKLGAKVVSLRFYTTPTDQVIPMQARAYRTAFNQTDPFIWWELCLDAQAKRQGLVPLFIYITWQRPDGTEHYQSENGVIPPEFKNFCLSAGWKETKPESWNPGTYTVVIRVDEKIVASGSFEVFQKVFKED